MREAEILSFIAKLACSRGNPLPADDIGRMPKSRIYAATDSVIQNTHYREDWLKPQDVAYKLFARNWSDFLVKNIRPEAALLNLGLRPRAGLGRFVRDFLRALDQLLLQHRITLIGGDCARAECDHFTLTFLGRRGHFVPRKARTIQPGDRILQFGAIGASEAARLLLEKNKTLPRQRVVGFLRPHVFPALPRSHQLLATIDQSDSVAKSLWLLAEANRAVLEVELSDLDVVPEYQALCEGNPQRLVAAAEDLAVFAIGRPRQDIAPAFRVIGKVKSIRSKAAVRYFWHGMPVALDTDEFEHF
ncbi:MAG: AIR synthase related protein [Turneriella sp.]|nr:AIR synthase related protein [Leptospiraceae bacterium]MCX7632715.1 AIR synthase related protein [Turneriella sp.]